MTPAKGPHRPEVWAKAAETRRIKWTPDMLALLENRAKLGLTLNEVAEKLGVGSMTLYRFRKKNPTKGVP